MKKVIILTLLLLAGATGGLMYYLLSNNGASEELIDKIVNEQMDEEKVSVFNFEMDKNAIVLSTSGDKKNVLNFSKNNIYEVSTSNNARQRLDRLIKRTNATFLQPIIALNPFGTNENSIYFYFNTSSNCIIKYTICVKDENIPDFVRYVKNGEEGNMSTTHEFTLAGMIPGIDNYILMQSFDKNGNEIDSRVYKYSCPNVNVKTYLDTKKDRSKEKSSQGLFFVFPNNSSCIPVYDNNGYLRNVVNTEGNHGSRIYEAGTSVVYQVSKEKIAKVSAIGRVTGIANLRGFDGIIDFSYDGYDNVYILAKKNKRDYLISISFSTGKMAVIYRFPKKVVAKSVGVPSGGGIYLLTAKPSGLVKLDNIASKSPKLAFVYGKASSWKNIVKKKKISKDKIDDGWDFSNSLLNTTSSITDLTTYLFDKGKGKVVNLSVDEKKKTLKENEKLELKVPGLCTCQKYKGHYIFLREGDGNFKEYDVTGDFVKQYSYGLAVSNVVKMDLNNMCFYVG